MILDQVHSSKSQLLGLFFGSSVIDLICSTDTDINTHYFSHVQLL